jgi:hypothetical protein
MRAAGEALAEPSPAGADAARLSEADTLTPPFNAANARRPRVSTAGLASNAGETAGRAETRRAGAVRAREPDSSATRIAMRVHGGREQQVSHGPQGPTPHGTREADTPAPPASRPGQVAQP